MLDFLKNTFNEYNQKHFQGKLKFISIVLTDKDDFKAAIFYKPFLHFKFSTLFLEQANEKEAKGVLLHEMIHYSLRHFGIKDTSSIFFGHSQQFKNLAKKISQKEKINIPLS